MESTNENNSSDLNDQRGQNMGMDGSFMQSSTTQRIGRYPQAGMTPADSYPVLDRYGGVVGGNDTPMPLSQLNESGRSGSMDVRYQLMERERYGTEPAAEIDTVVRPGSGLDYDDFDLFDGQRVEDAQGHGNEVDTFMHHSIAGSAYTPHGSQLHNAEASPATLSQHSSDLGYRFSSSQASAISPQSQQYFSPPPRYNDDASSGIGEYSPFPPTQTSPVFNMDGLDPQSFNPWNNPSPIAQPPTLMAAHNYNGFAQTGGGGFSTNSPQFVSQAASISRYGLIEPSFQPGNSQPHPMAASTSPNPFSPHRILMYPTSPAMGTPYQNGYQQNNSLMPSAPPAPQSSFLPRANSQRNPETPPPTAPQTSRMASIQATAPPTPPSPTPVPGQRFACRLPNCLRTFTRKDDRDRHEQTTTGHTPGGNGGHHFCTVPHCDRSVTSPSFRGYTRPDKVLEHQWKKHADLGFQKRQ